MTNRNLCPTLLEQLPVKIFFQIFALLPLQEVVKAFSDLNSSIDTSIQAITNAIHTVTYNDTAAIGVLLAYPTCIGRLIVTHSPAVDFTSLINLQSLTLKYGTRKQFDGIRPEHFSQLEILHLCGSE